MKDSKTLTDLLDQIERRANAATPEPWIVTPNHQIVSQKRQQPPTHVSFLKRREWSETLVHDGDFIAAARSDVPALVKAMREARRMYTVEVGPDSWEHKNFDSVIVELLREPADSVQDGNAANPSPVTPNPDPSPSSAVADDKQGLRRLLAINDELWTECTVQWRHDLYQEAHKLAKQLIAADDVEAAREIDVRKIAEEFRYEHFWALANITGQGFQKRIEELLTKVLSEHGVNQEKISE